MFEASSLAALAIASSSGSSETITGRSNAERNGEATTRSCVNANRRYRCHGSTRTFPSPVPIARSAAVHEAGTREGATYPPRPQKLPNEATQGTASSRTSSAVRVRLDTVRRTSSATPTPNITA